MIADLSKATQSQLEEFVDNFNRVGRATSDREIRRDLLEGLAVTNHN